MAYPYCPLCKEKASVGLFYAHCFDAHGIDFDYTNVCACGENTGGIIEFVKHALNCQEFAVGMAATALTRSTVPIWQQKFWTKIEKTGNV